MYTPRTSEAMYSIQLQRLAAWMFQTSSLIKLIFAAMVAAVLVYGDTQGWSFTRYLRVQVVDLSVPALTISHTVTHWVRAKLQNVQLVFTLSEENQRLKTQLEQMLQWKNLANQLALENLQLKQFLNVPISPSKKFVTAKVLTYSSSPSNQTLLINVGRHQGITEYQPVVTPKGVVGRVLEVGEKSARVILITDPRSGLPVQGTQSDFEAILKGTSKSTLEIRHLKGKTEPLSNQQLVTSGKGKVFPPGLVAATLSRQPETQTLMASPQISWGDIDYVQVIKSPEIKDRSHD